MSEVQELKFAYWYVTHKVMIKRIILFILLGIAVLLWTISITIFVRQFFIFADDQQMALATLPQDQVAYEVYQTLHAPSDPQVTARSVIRTQDNEFDLVVRLNNPNDNWLARFDYAFQNGSEATPVQQGFLLPGQERDFYALGVESARAISQAEPLITNIRWLRTEDTQAVLDERLRFMVNEEQIAFTQTDRGDGRVSTLDFLVTNETSFSFWNVGFNIRIQSGTRVVAVNQVIVDQFMAGTTREVTVSWFEDLPTIANPRIIIEPYVNVFDDEVYILPTS